jgi:hypothetical protein
VEGDPTPKPTLNPVSNEAPNFAGSAVIQRDVLATVREEEVRGL